MHRKVKVLKKKLILHNSYYYVSNFLLQLFYRTELKNLINQKHYYNEIKYEILFRCYNQKTFRYEYKIVKLV